MSTHPTLGVAGSKPRLSKPDGNGAPSKEALAQSRMNTWRLGTRKCGPKRQWLTWNYGAAWAS